MKKWILGAVVSLLSLFFLFQSFSLEEFDRLNGQMQWIFLPVLFGTMTLAFVPFSFRWYLLLDKRIPFWQAFRTAVIGVSLNLVLPARGGDLLRLVMVKNQTGIGIPSLLSQLFLEKVLDLGTVVLVGGVALLLLGLGTGDNLLLVFLSGGAIILMITILFLLRKFRDPFRNFLRKISEKLSLLTFYETKIDHHLIAFQKDISGNRLLLPLLISPPTWVLGYATNYFITGLLIGQTFSPIECLLFIFVGAMGVAIPSAPSGIGVFHASIVSGFLLLGREPGLGFVYATVLHLTQMVLMLLLAGILALLGGFKRKET